MTDANLPQPTRRARTVLTQISTRAWEHPADRAALNAMRSIPGFDEVEPRNREIGRAHV